jgi:UDP-glucose 4-epimerase
VLDPLFDVCSVVWCIVWCSLVNSSDAVIDLITVINKRKVRPAFYKIDLCNALALDILFDVYRKLGRTFDAVIHFAGLKVLCQAQFLN